MRRLLAGLLAVWLMMLQFPFTIPVPAGGKDLSVPFICMDRACGCLSAEQCWKSCCCTTVEERIAFARSLGLPVPAEVCEKTESKTETCSTHACCSTAQKPTDEEQEPAEEPKPDAPVAPETHEIVLISALRCQGIALNLLQFAGLVISPPAMELCCHLDVLGTTVLMDEHSGSAELSPPIPPPRLACA